MREPGDDFSDDFESHGIRVGQIISDDHNGTIQIGELEPHENQAEQIELGISSGSSSSVELQTVNDQLCDGQTVIYNQEYIYPGQSYGNNVYEFSYQQTGSSSYSPSDDVTYNLAQPFLHDVTKSDDVTNSNDNDDSLTTRSSLSTSGGDTLANEHTEFYPMGNEQTLDDSQIVLIPQDFSQNHVYTSLPNKSA